MNARRIDVAFEHAHAVIVFERAEAVDGQLGAGREAFDIAFEFTTAEQETERYGIAALARMATGAVFAGWEYFIAPFVGAVFWPLLTNVLLIPQRRGTPG